MSLRSNSYGRNYITLAAPTTTQVKNGPGVFKRIVFNTPVSTGVVTIYDNQASDTTNPVAIITSTADLKPFYLDYDFKFTNGLKVVTSVAAQNITVIYD